MPFETAQITGGKSPDIQISIYPAVAQITWTWEDEEGIVQDYEHFSIPFILTVDKVLGKIGRLLGNMAKENLICKTDKGKKWNITEKGESELGI